MAPVRRNGDVVATVWVPPLTGPSRILNEFGSSMAIGVLLLIVGTVVAALTIFRPAHTQLRALEDAARRFGEGDVSARAPDTGGDEVAAVAAAFNRMAGELAARQAQLEEADRVRRQLLADVSHELMTPLTAIRGYAETLALPQFSPSTPEGQRAVRVIHEEGERIERLVSDLLDLARFEAGGISLAVQSVLVRDLFERVVARHEQPAREKGVQLEAELVDPQLRVSADPHRLEQALQNLASNALRHTAPGGTVSLSAIRVDTSVHLRVADTGVGILPEHLPHVFDRFYKADQSRSQTGSGLGLSIVKAIVERHGGTVNVASTPGVETAFEIELPERAPGPKPQASSL
jgi:signal transduction histidine kinase